jgi:hypothetical protein
MQAEPLHKFANPFIRSDSPKQEALAEVLKDKLCPMVEKALAKVPAFDPGWERIAHKQFENMFQILVQAQTTVPSLAGC